MSNHIISTFVDPNAHLPFEERISRCYELSGKALMDDDNGFLDDLTLVHGTIQRGGFSAIGHAWLEWSEEGEELVFEPTTGKVLSKGASYWLFNMIPRVKYSDSEARFNMVKYGHYGNWDDYVCTGKDYEKERSKGK